jgi:aminopeptidase
VSDTHIKKFAQILVDYSAKVKPGDTVAIITSTLAEPLVRELYQRILERGGLPHALIELPDQYEVFLRHGSDEQLQYVPRFHKIAFEEFDVLLKVRAASNTRSLSHVNPARQSQLQRSIAKLLEAQMQRGASGELRWMSTIFPTDAYAMEAEMGLGAYQDYFYRAVHADEDTPDPVAYWQGIKAEQKRYVDRIEGHDLIQLRGPNVDLSLSVKDRLFINACGENNMPDGEVYTGPVEDSANGWVRFSYPTAYQGRIVEGVELNFQNGQVIKVSATKNEEFLLRMLDSDPGARFLGEFAIGTNYQIDRFTKNILLDEKIGGSFHVALGAGYPETGSVNHSQIHWDMICDMRQDSEIVADGEVIYKNGQFLF